MLRIRTRYEKITLGIWLLSRLAFLLLLKDYVGKSEYRVILDLHLLWIAAACLAFHWMYPWKKDSEDFPREFEKRRLPGWGAPVYTFVMLAALLAICFFCAERPYLAGYLDLTASILYGVILFATGTAYLFANPSVRHPFRKEPGE